ncbi:MAG: hypothetical protein N2234_01930, partial [Planctomycetota bacterium]|nr:hypothetical protein [Planctomycetota bacterium]
MVRTGIVAVVVSVAVFLLADEVDDLIAKLGVDEWSEREAASKALAEKGDSVVPRLMEAYKKSEDFEVRSRLVTILEKLGYPAPDECEKIEKLLNDYENLRFKEGENEEEKKEEKAAQEQSILEELQKIKNLSLI